MNKIPYEARCEVYRQAIWKYGIPTQIVVAIEEMSEVAKALTKYLRCPTIEKTIRKKNKSTAVTVGFANRNLLASIIEEVADATIMLEQLRLIFGINDEVCEAMDAKIKRLKERVGE